MAPQSFGESLVGCYIRGDLLPSVGQLTADDRRQHRSTSASHKDSNDGCQYMGCLPPPTHGRSGDSSGSPPSGRPAEPTGADAPTSTSGDDTRFGPVEAAVRRFVEWHRTQNGATTTFGIVWFLFAGLVNALAINGELGAYFFPNTTMGPREMSPGQQFVASILLALQAGLLAVFCMGFKFTQQKGLPVYRRFLLLQGFVWLLRAVSAIAPGISRHSKLIFSTKLSIAGSPAIRMISQLQSWGYHPFTGHAADFMLLGMLWHRFRPDFESKLLMWLAVASALIGLLWTHMHDSVDVYLGTLVGTLVCHAYDSYVKRTSWSLINEGQAAQHHGCFKPFVCWYEGMAAPVAPAGKKYRVFPFGSRRYDDLDVRIVIARPDVSKGLGAAQSIYAM